MLRDGKKKPNAWIKPGEKSYSACGAPDSDSGEEGGIAAPDYHKSFCDAIQTALDNIPTGIVHLAS